jgi:hypothetical protein
MCPIAHAFRLTRSSTRATAQPVLDIVVKIAGPNCPLTCLPAAPTD